MVRNRFRSVIAAAGVAALGCAFVPVAGPRDAAAGVPGAAPAAEDRPDGAFRDPSTYHFAMAHITDTQYLSSCGAGLSAKKQRCIDIYHGMNRWIVDQAAPRKIAYTAHTGDIIDSQWAPADVASKKQFDVASSAQKVLDDARMPNGVLPGNHDNVTGRDGRLYNTYFGPDRYRKASAAAATPYYQGPWKDGDNSNHVDTFRAGGVDIMVVYLGYDVSDAAVQWADQQIKAHPRHNVVVATHAYLKPGPGPTGTPAGDSRDGATVRDKVVAPHRNVFLVLSGHEHGVARNVRHDLGSPGHTVIELMADYQNYSAGDDGNGHAGFVRLLQFDTERGQMTVDTYSPSLKSFRSRDFDTQPGRGYDGTEDEFTLPVSWIRPG